MHDFRKLSIWTDSKYLVKDVYQKLRNFPKDEVYGLSSQIKRSAVSIPSNIAEGAGRSTNKDFAKYISIAIGSAYELETQIEIAYDLKFISIEERDELINKLKMVEGKMFNFRKRLLD